MGRITVDFTFAIDPELELEEGLRHFTLSFDSKTPPWEIEQQGEGKAREICYNQDLPNAKIVSITYKPRRKPRPRKR